MVNRSTDDLSGAAAGYEQWVDWALTAAGGARRHGVFSEVALSRKIRDEWRLAPRLSEVSLPEEVVLYLLSSFVRELGRIPTLTRKERSAAILSISGCGRSEAATLLNVCPRRYSKALASAQEKIARYQADPYAGWYEVYLAEVNRYVYRRRAVRNFAG